MFTISVAFGPANHIWAFMFKTELAARQQYNKLAHPESVMPVVEITDDFTQTASFFIGDIHAVSIEDMDVSMNAGIERGLHQARTQARGNQLASSDPALKAAAMLGGHAMQGNGGMPRM